MCLVSKQDRDNFYKQVRQSSTEERKPDHSGIQIKENSRLRSDSDSWEDISMTHQRSANDEVIFHTIFNLASDGEI